MSETSNKVDSINSFPDEFKETNIIKAKFIFSAKKIYILEFDQNILMKDLKSMIKKASHLVSKNFRIISEGSDYTKYEKETFESLFPNKKFVIFTIEIDDTQLINDIELYLDMKPTCKEHKEKFLLNYCFDCNQSICYECSNTGIHKGHKVQDKIFYLLPSKYLVDKLFENDLQIPHKVFQYKEDEKLSELKSTINNNFFEKLFEILKEIQNKVMNLIDIYHNINFQLYDNIRIKKKK